MREFGSFDSRSIRSPVSKSFFGTDSGDIVKYVLPLQGNWFVPTVEAEETVSTWVGYAITKIKPRITMVTKYTEEGKRIDLRNCAVTVRLSSVGKQAEEMITSTLWWDQRTDVKRAWEDVGAQLAWSDRMIDTYVYNQKGFNTELIWSVDLLFMVWMFTKYQEERWEQDVLLNGRVKIHGDLVLPADYRE